MTLTGLEFGVLLGLAIVGLSSLVVSIGVVAIVAVGDHRRPTESESPMDVVSLAEQLVEVRSNETSLRS